MENQKTVIKATVKQEDEPGGKIDVPPGRCGRKSSKFHTSIDELSRFVAVKPEELDTLRQIEKKYHVLVTDHYLSLIADPDDPMDPVRMQCIPHIHELDNTAETDIDPLGEEDTSPVSCLVHRYPDRALLLVTGRCFMYCRHCTRKRLWDKNCVDPSLNEIAQAADYIKEHKNIREVIVSGGDPLILNTEKLEFILDMLSAIDHVEAIRIGTRTPVVYPKRIDKQLCKALEKYNNLWINVQFNHPQEISPEAVAACRRLQKCGIPVSNQSVLLKGINDNPETMKKLCHLLQSHRIRPYYLFQCDAVDGAAHFRTSVYRGIEIIEQMRGHTGGMCLPVFVIDGPEGKGKIPISPNYMLSMTPEKLTLRNYENKVFDYINPKH